MWKKIILAAVIVSGGLVSGFAAYESGTNPTIDENAQLCPIGENGEPGDCYNPRKNSESGDGCQGPYCEVPYSK